MLLSIMFYRDGVECALLRIQYRISRDASGCVAPAVRWRGDAVVFEFGGVVTELGRFP